MPTTIYILKRHTCIINFSSIVIFFYNQNYLQPKFFIICINLSSIVIILVFITEIIYALY